MTDREKLIELLCKVQYQGNAVHGYQDKYIQNSELADHLIANGVTLDNQVSSSKWISVKDRLPEEDGDYLIYVTVPFTGSKFMTVMHYEKDAYSQIWMDTTHWMPLPQPPKGE